MRIDVQQDGRFVQGMKLVKKWPEAHSQRPSFKLIPRFRTFVIGPQDLIGGGVASAEIWMTMFYTVYYTTFGHDVTVAPAQL